MPQAGRPTTERAERLRDLRELLIATVADLTADGTTFTELKLAALVDAAGVSRTTFYVYFESKTDLLRSWFGEAMGTLARIVSPLEDVGDLQRAALDRVLHDLSTAYRDRVQMFELVYEAAAYEPTIRDQFAVAREVAASHVESVLRRGQNEGWITHDLDAREIAWWLCRMTARGLSQIIGRAAAEDLPAIVDSWTHIVWRTLQTGRTPIQRLPM